jgi:deoxyribodipyrimidine photo-lyase
MKGIQESRIRHLNAISSPAQGDYVLYWMQQSQRAHDNHALEFAVSQANALKRPLLVVFGFTPNYPEANRRHFTFMLQGLEEVAASLKQRKIGFRMASGNPAQVAVAHARKACLVVCDRGYLRHQRQWRQALARKAPCPVIQVETDVIVPVETASAKQEYAARTIRPKIERLLPAYLHAAPRVTLKYPGADLAEPPDFKEFHRAVAGLDLQPVTPFFQGGRRAAMNRLSRFINEKLPEYARNRNHPDLDASSRISPYLHFGQISALQVALRVQEADAPDQDRRDFLEELIVRRALAVNYVYYSGEYDQYGGMPAWTRKTLRDHQRDRRDPRYSLDGLERGQTHDVYWNAAMQEMKTTGYMHNYMRMYWGKKILQWSASPEDAFRTILTMNNKYFLDGRDPNSYAGVGWVFGLHDRPWKERPVFGMVRYMAHSGLKRKFNMEGYLDKVRRYQASAAG